MTLTFSPIGGESPLLFRPGSRRRQLLRDHSGLALKPGFYSIGQTADLAGNVSVASAALAPSLNIAVAPSVTTQAATDVASTTATGNGTIVALGQPAHSLRYGVEHHGLTDPGGQRCNNGAAMAGPFMSALTGLSPNTYYVRAFATNALTTSYGDQGTFTSLQAFLLTYTAGDGSRHRDIAPGRRLRRQRDLCDGCPKRQLPFRVLVGRGPDCDTDGLGSDCEYRCHGDLRF